MTSPKLLACPRRESSGELKTSAGRGRPLPDDLLRQASRRLEIMALISAALWVLGPTFARLALYVTNPADPRIAHFGGIDLICTAGVSISLALFFFLRRRKRDPALVMDIGLVYMVVTALDVGLLMHWGPASTTPLVTTPTISWIGPVILMFAAIVPAAPWKMAVAGFVAASMDPLGMWIGRAAGLYHFDSAVDPLVMHYPNYLLLGVAVMISGVVTRLGQQVVRERELGSYRLGELLGRGGMGEVYRATHRMLARPAAIKLIRPEVLAAGDGAKAQLATLRFRREAEAAARLRSPHTVALYDFGVTEEGRLYLVMELLEGTNLETLVREHGPLPAARVISILRQVCDSLEEAHAAGLVHRDIKPANIHLGLVGVRQDFVKVLDFGLVKSMSAGDGDESLASAAGITPGTPAYMAPEMSHEEAVDGRADLYSLGCVAYFLLTGRLVFEADTAIQMIVKHLQEAPFPPSARTHNLVPPALESLVLACLAKRPADRPASAAELGRVLDALQLQLEPRSEEHAVRW